MFLPSISQISKALVAEEQPPLCHAIAWRVSFRKQSILIWPLKKGFSPTLVLAQSLLTVLKQHFLTGSSTVAQYTSGPLIRHMLTSLRSKRFEGIFTESTVGPELGPWSGCNYFHTPLWVSGGHRSSGGSRSEFHPSVPRPSSQSSLQEGRKCCEAIRSVHISLLGEDLSSFSLSTSLLSTSHLCQTHPRQTLYWVKRHRQWKEL